MKEITFIVYGPIGQACWKLFAICDFGNGGVCQREATADWVVTRLYGYHSARTFVKVCPPTYPNYVPVLYDGIEDDPPFIVLRRVIKEESPAVAEVGVSTVQ